eukprot:gene1606-447_t
MKALMIFTAIASVSSAGERKIFMATQDTNFATGARTGPTAEGSAWSPERNENGGGDATLEVKDSRELFLADFDITGVDGWTFSSATLYVRQDVSHGLSRLLVADVSTISAPWFEGNSHKGSPAKPGESTYLWRRKPTDEAEPRPEDHWAYRGSAFGDVAWTNGGTIFSYDGWTAISLDPNIAHGLHLDQHGVVLCDSSTMNGDPEWSQPADLLDVWLMSREAGPEPLPCAVSRDTIPRQSVPYLAVTGGRVDFAAPAVVGNLSASTLGLWNGQVRLQWLAPGDDGVTGKAFGYNITVDGTLCPRWATPRPLAAGMPQHIVLDGLTAGSRACIAVNAYDELALPVTQPGQAGNPGPPSTTCLTLPPTRSPEKLPSSSFKPFSGGAPVEDGLMQACQLSTWRSHLPGTLVFVVEPLVKADPISGQLQCPAGVCDGAKGGNSVWDAQGGAVHLSAAAGEVVDFKVYVGHATPGPAVLAGCGVAFGGQFVAASGTGAAPQPEATVHREWYAQGKDGGWYSSAVLPMDESCPYCGTTFGVPTTDWGTAHGQQFQGIWVDVWVPPSLGPGQYTSSVVVTCQSGSARVEQAVKLVVLPFALPEQFTWRVDMNGYGYNSTFNQMCGQGISQQDCMVRAHQLAHSHRLSLDIVEYPQCWPPPHQPNYTTPPVQGTGLNTTVRDWSRFDSFLGPLFDGSAFTEKWGYKGPGYGYAVSSFMLSLFENYPAMFQTHYQPQGMYDLYFANRSAYLSSFLPLEQALGSEYQDSMVAVAREFVLHFSQKNWTRTHFQMFLNNKWDFHCTDGTTPSSLWNFDESVEYIEFQALELFMQLVQKGIDMAAQPEVLFELRQDISTRYPQHKGALDSLSLVDGNYFWVNQSMALVGRRKRDHGNRVWFYGSGPDEDESPHRLPLLTMQQFTQGAEGHLPYWECCYKGGDVNLSDTSPMLLGPLFGSHHPIPSPRLKALRFSQQLAEYAILLSTKKTFGGMDAVLRAISSTYGLTP